MSEELKDFFRWLEKDGKKVLQVRRIVSNINNEGQGVFYDEWIDVPIVSNKEEIDEKINQK